MSSATIALRPLALPTEHGGWGFLFEPLVLALIVAPSPGGAFVALAFMAGFLARQPLKLALQDLLRGKCYPRTRWCWRFALGYSFAAVAALAGAIAIAGPSLLLPLALAAPLGLVQIAFDAKNRSRALLPELAGATAMSSSAAAIAIAAHASMALAATLSALIIARSLPSITYVRTLLTRAHGKEASSGPALALHALAVVAAGSFAPLAATLAMAVLLGRAAYGLTHAVPPAKQVGWTEIAFGTLTVALLAAAFL